MFFNLLFTVQGTTAPSEMSDGSSTHGYPDFPPSPDSWLGENPTSHRYWDEAPRSWVSERPAHRYYPIMSSCENEKNQNNDDDDDNSLSV